MAELTISPEHADPILEPGILFPPEESGMFHRRNAYPSSYPVRRLWRLTWNLIRPDDLAAIRALWREVRGMVLPFDWTPPGGSPGRARFVEQLTVEQRGPKAASLQITLEEVR